MFCKKCGKEIDDGVKFCPYCGTNMEAEIQPSAPTETPAATTEVTEDKPPKVWTVFSLVGKILGIVCLCASLIPYVNWFSFGFGIAGIVFSCLGRKAKTEATDRNCSIGLKLSIAAVVISFVMIIVYAVVFALVLGEALVSFTYY